MSDRSFIWQKKGEVLSLVNKNSQTTVMAAGTCVENNGTVVGRDMLRLKFLIYLIIIFKFKSIFKQILIFQQTRTVSDYQHQTFGRLEKTNAIASKTYTWHSGHLLIERT